MLKFLIFFAICFIFSNVSAHPDRLVKKKINWNEGDNLPVILSYHIHCVFVNADSSIVQKAANLYKDFQIQFNLTSSPLCNSTFDEKRICMFGKFERRYIWFPYSKFKFFYKILQYGLKWIHLLFRVIGQYFFHQAGSHQVSYKKKLCFS